MRRAVLGLAVAGLLLGGQAAPVVDKQQPLRAEKGRELTGRFLQITDLHLDPFYKYHSSVSEEGACHRGKGPAGVYGAETTDCDSPISLINATFKWIEENLKDEIDFIIWTGDSARHDNDEKHPRTEKQITSLNRLTVSKFLEVFGKPDDDDDPTNDLRIPIVPTWGNNDILPHNIFTKGPNRWTRDYLAIWRAFIPEAQRHTFSRGGYFSVEVIPNQLAVFSLNSLYFFDSNVAVDGCANKHQPGYQQFEWLRVQLLFMRKRGMKAILMGHVPPARAGSKMSWDETCWQKYSLWMRQYRDVVVGSLWGHMNIDHFMLQDFDEIDIEMLEAAQEGEVKGMNGDMVALDDELSVQSATDYLSDLREDWAKLPKPPADVFFREEGKVEGLKKKGKGKKGKKHNEDKFFDKIGGEWAERYSLSLVSPSIVPNYFPSLRIIEYNISGLNSGSIVLSTPVTAEHLDEDEILKWENDDKDEHESAPDDQPDLDAQKKNKKKPKFKTPKSPSKSSPPGPAYSPQTFTWLGYRQLFANLTVINNDFAASAVSELEPAGWKHGKHPNKEPKDRENKRPDPHPFKFELEYDTRNDSVFKLEDLTVRSYVELAARIGRFKPNKGDRLTPMVVEGEAEEEEEEEEEDEGGEGDVDVEVVETVGGGDGDEEDASNLLPTEQAPNPSQNSDSSTLKHKHKKDKKKKKKTKKHRRAKNKVWFAFVKRAFVGSKDEEDLHETFGQRSEGAGVDAETERSGPEIFVPPQWLER